MPTTSAMRHIADEESDLLQCRLSQKLTVSTAPGDVLVQADTRRSVIIWRMVTNVQRSGHVE